MRVRRLSTWTLSLSSGVGALFLTLLLFPVTAATADGDGSFGHHEHHGFETPGSAVVDLENGPYGPVLVVGGAGAGYIPPTSTTPASYAYPAGSSLYLATVDPSTYGASWFHGYTPGCTTTVVPNTSQGPLSCTGPETDQTADWPAFTTRGYPIAGPGVNRWLLGAVWRSDLHEFQVTYAGHPLYLFDPGPNSFFGANFYETVLPIPPWNTAWYLLSPWGTPASGPASLGTEAPQPGTTYTSTKLTGAMLPNAVNPPNGLPVSLYTFSADGPNFSRCYGACARDFIPLYTVGTPTVGTGVNGSAVGVIHRWDGTEQVTYDGQPLYLYSQEAPLPNPTPPPMAPPIMANGTTGNGQGVTGFGGTLSLVNP
jgi:predicted lipoprotein with Yx(FWY)xxD motif